MHRLSDGKHIRFCNSGPGLRGIGRWVGRQAVRIVYEATGRYHRELEQTLGSAGHGLVKVNPRRARRFAVAMGLGAKTDRVDAALLARMGSVLDLETTLAPTESMNQIRELQVLEFRLDQGSHCLPEPHSCSAQQDRSGSASGAAAAG